MKAVKIRGADTYNEPEGEFKGAWVRWSRIGSHMAYVPSEEEKEKIANGAAIVLTVAGVYRPATGVTVEYYDEEGNVP